MTHGSSGCSMESRIPSRRLFAIDTVFMLLMIGPTITARSWTDVLTPFVLPIAALYTLPDLLACGRSLRLFHFEISSRLTFHLKLLIIWSLIGLSVLLPTLSAMILRQATEPHLYVQDGLIQTEEAIKFLLKGQNPYVEDYTGTAMADVPFEQGGLTTNPALYHLVYLPATFTLPIPLYLILNSALQWYDQRLFHLLVFLVLLILLPVLADSPEHKLSLLLVVGLNPLLAPFLVEGHNDILVLFWLVVTTLLLRRGQVTGSAITLGLACSTKQTAWFFVPFYFVYVISGTTSMAQARLALRRTLPAALVTAAFLVPFLVWNPQAFLDDIWRYLSGGTATAYPLTGMGFGTAALQLGLVAQSTDAFPLWLFQLGLGMPVLAVLLWTQWKTHSLRWIWLSYGLLGGIISYFNRVFYPNYLGGILVALLIAQFMGSSASPSADRQENPDL